MKIKELLTDASKWTQGTSARNAQGKAVPTKSPEATSWCLVAAYVKVYGSNNFDEFKLKVNSQLNRAMTEPVSTWNDVRGRTFEEVKQLVNDLDI